MNLNSLFCIVKYITLSHHRTKENIFDTQRGDIFQFFAIHSLNRNNRLSKCKINHNSQYSQKRSVLEN